MGLNTIYLDKIHPDIDNFGDDGTEIIVHDRLKTQVIDINNARHVKKDISKELMALAWHPAKWCDCFYDKGFKKIEPFLIHEKQFKVN